MTNHCRRVPSLAWVTALEIKLQVNTYLWWSNIEEGSPNQKSSSHKKSRGGHGSHHKDSKDEKREKLRKLLLEKLDIEDIREVRLKGVNQFDTKFNHTSAADSHNAYTDMTTSPSKEARQGFKNKMFRIPLFGESDNTEDKLRSVGTAANTASIPPVAMKVECNSRGKLDFINGTIQ